MCVDASIGMRMVSAYTQTFTIAGVFFAYHASQSRLVGFWDNGLRWNVPTSDLKKFDVTSRYEANTVWKRFRVNTE